MMSVTRGICTSLLLATSAFAQQTDARAKTTLSRPPTRAPVVADAAMRGDAAAVRAALAQGADVNAPQGDGMTALHWAADHGDSAMAAMLVKARANVKATTRIGAYTPLHIASKSGMSGVVKVLLNAGADANAGTTSGATPLHLAAAGGNPDAVNALLDHGAKADARESEWNQTPLVFAAEYDRPAAITALLKRGADPSIHTATLNLNEESAREQAATKRRNEVLISFEPEKHKGDSAKAVQADTAGAGATPASGYFVSANAAPQQQRGGGGRGAGGPQPKGPFTPEQIQAAIDSGRRVMATNAAAKGPVTEVVDTINGGVAGFQGSVGGVGGMTALHHAVREGNIGATIALLDGGANINDTTLVDHSTPLVLAAINGQFDVMMKLIERGANPNLVTTAGMTPLWATINTQWMPKTRYPQPQDVQIQKTSYLDVIQALLKAGANPNARLTAQPWYFAFNNCGNANCGLENVEGTTAFWRAAYALDVDAMRILVKAGADPSLPSFRAPQAGGRGGRGGARGAGAPAGAAGGGGGGGRGFVNAVPLDPAIDSAAKANPPGIGVFPIHAVSGVGYGNGFAGNSHRHAPDGWMPAIRYLVEELHADVNARDINGFTPMHHAAARGDNEMILYLVSKGADPRAVALRGQTTVDMANGPVQRLRPIPETIALLEKLGAKNSHKCVSCSP
jgi:ankyrin repeat protein